MAFRAVPKEHWSARRIELETHSGGDAPEPTMRGLADILERKRKVLDRRREAEPARLAAVERELQEIGAVLTRPESVEAAPAAPQ